MRSPVHRRRIGANPLASAMTPMIDVVFLLLVFFLCTASFEQPEEDLAASLVVETSSVAGGAGELVLPEALDEVNVVGRLTPGGVVWSVNDGPTVASPAELARLLAQLAAIDRGLPVTIDSGPRVPLEEVVQAYDASRVAGFGRVLLMASPLPSERTPRVIRSLLIALLLAGHAEAQQSDGSLGDDLRRASSRVFTGGGERSEVDRLAASAAEAFRDEDADRGVQLLDEAAAIAYRTGATTRAFELSLAAAEAQRTAGRLADSAERFQHAALRSAADPRAAAAHRLACQALAAVSNDPKALETYEAALRQHESTWPASETAEACRWDRVGLLARRGQWESVISACQAVDPNEDRYAASRRLLVNAYAKLLDGRETDERFSAALGDLEALVLGASWRWPTDWTPLQRDAALVLARAHLGRSPEASADAEKYARIALRGRPAPSESWRRSAASLLVVITLVMGESSQASEWMAMASDASPAERDELLRATAEAVRRAPDRAGLLAAADRLTRNVSTLDAEPSDEAKAPATAAQAIALRDAGRLDEARQVYARLAEQRPNDRDVQVAYAELLTASDRPDDAAEAARRWQAIETRTPRSTPDWFAARLGRVQSLARSGQTDEARKLLALTRLLAPSLSGAATRAEFEKLEQTLR